MGSWVVLARAYRPACLSAWTLASSARSPFESSLALDLTGRSVFGLRITGGRHPEILVRHLER